VVLWVRTGDLIYTRSQNIQNLANQLILRTISAFERFKENLGSCERQVDDIVKTDSHKNIHFQDNRVYGNLPREKIIDSLIKQTLH